MPTMIVPVYRPLLIQGLKLRALCSSSCSQTARTPRDSRQLVVLAVRACNASKAASAASMPDLIAAWLPLMRAGVQEAGVAADQRAARERRAWAATCRPPAVIARAP